MMLQFGCRVLSPVTLKQYQDLQTNLDSACLIAVILAYYELHRKVTKDQYLTKIK